MAQRRDDADPRQKRSGQFTCRATLSLLVCCLAVGEVRAAEGGEEAGQRLITVTGRGMVNVRPDVVRVRLGLRVKASTVGEAMEQNRVLMTRIIDSLRGLDIEDRDIMTNRFAVHQERPPRPERREDQEPLSYVVNNMVSVTIRDLEAIDDVLEAATEAGANEVHGIHFGVEKTAKPASEARRLASNEARSKAEELARLNKARLGPVLRIRELGGSGPPMPMMAEAATFRAQSTVSVGEMQFSAHIEFVYALE